MSRVFEASIEPVREVDRIVGYRWVLYAPNGSPIAQQAAPSPTEKAAKRSFTRYCDLTAEIDSNGWDARWAG